MSTAIQITGDAIPWTKRVQAAMKSERLTKVMAAQGAKTVRENFRALASERHGGGSHNYYGGAARATTWEASGGDASIVIDHVGIRQRYYGGTIRAKAGGALTIPVKGSAAVGKRASEFGDLFSVRSAGSGAYLGFLARLGAAGELEPLYWLRKSVTQREDPTVLPTDQRLMTDMGDALNRELDRI